MHHRYPHTIAGLLLLAWSCHALAQPVNPRYSFSQLNIQNGLADNIVYHFLQDSRGCMWMGTRNGLSLYDGTRTLVFRHDERDSASPSGNLITGIQEDEQARIWISTDAGIDRYDRLANRFVHYQLTGQNGKPEKAYCSLLGIVAHSDLWFIETRSWSIQALDSKQGLFRRIGHADAADGVLVYDSHSGHVEVWTYLSIGATHLVFLHDSLLREQHFFGKAGGHGQRPLQIFHVCPENDSSAWLSCSVGLIDLNPLTGRFRIYDQAGSEKLGELRCSLVGSGGILWVGTGQSGIFRFDLIRRRFLDHFVHVESDPQCIGSNNIVSLCLDREGNLWCGSYGYGVSYAQVNENRFSKYLSKQSLMPWRRSNSVLWLGSDRSRRTWCILRDVPGFWILDSSLEISQYLNPRMTDGSAFRATAYSLLFDRYPWAWCTTNHGLFRYNTRTNRMQAVPYRAFSRTLFGSYWINDMIRLHDGSVLFSTFDGLYQIWREGGRDRIEPFPLLNDRAYRNYDALFQDSRGNLFVRDNGDSLHVLRQTGSGREYQQVHGVVFLDDLLCMEEDIRSDRLYIGTNAGLFILHLQDLTLERPTINDALKLQNISRLLIRDADLWIFEERGLFRLSLADGSFRLFTTEDGLPSNEFNPSSEWTPDGNYLVATQNGLVSFSPFHAAEKIYPPRVQLTHIYVNDLPKDFAPNPQELDRVNLQHDENTFALEFSAIAFQHASGARFAYRLEGFDDQWIDNGTSHSTRYSRIPPGDYTFLLRVRQADGKFSPYVKKLEIHIARAFWQTSGFLALTLLVLGLGIWGLVRTYWRFRLGQHRRRFEREQALQKERTRIATDMHDDLGAGLSRIKFLSETIGMKTKMRQPIEEEVGSIGQYANDMIGKMGEIVWALNEKNDSLSDLLAYMRSYAVDYLLQNGIGCKVKSSADFPAQHVSGEFRRNVFLTVKEALHNIVKHARASEVNIIIETGDRLRISICDNGVGFQASRMRAFSTGLNSMQRRMESIGGSWELHHEGGTCIRISAPLTP